MGLTKRPLEATLAARWAGPLSPSAVKCTTLPFSSPPLSTWPLAFLGPFSTVLVLEKARRIVSQGSGEVRKRELAGSIIYLSLVAARNALSIRLWPHSAPRWACICGFGHIWVALVAIGEGVCTTLSGDAPDELALLVAGSYAPQWPEQRPHRLLQYQNAWASIFTGALLFNQIPYLLGH